RLVSVQALDGFDERTILSFAGSVESVSEHPLASAIIAGARERGLPLSPVSAFSATPGKGISGTVDGHAVAVGTPRLLEAHGIFAVPAERAEAWRREGQTVTFIAIDGKPAGLLGVADPIK